MAEAEPRVALTRREREILGSLAEGMSGAAASGTFAKRQKDRLTRHKVSTAPKA